MKRKTADELAALTLETVEAAFMNATEWPDRGKLMEETAREVIIKKLLPLPEPTAKKKSEIRHHMKNFKRVARTEFIKIAKKLPKNPGGRRKALTPEKTSQACQDMATLLYQGVEKADACKRIAAKYGISLWTMARYWRQYQQSQTKH